MKRMMILGIALFMLNSCFKDDGDDVRSQFAQYIFEFEESAEGWEGDFADYPAGEEEAYELEFEYTKLPFPLDDEGAVRLSGKNMSDDLFMYLKRQVGGLDALTTYYVRFIVEFASDVPDGMAGVGGSPGESVWIKAGATTSEPGKETDDMDYYRMNIDKGNQSQGGADMKVLGDFSNDTDEEVYTLKTLTSETSLEVTTDENGQLWLIVGTDSGFEATTNIYYNSIRAELYMEEFYNN